jgi:hypothetical protein
MDRTESNADSASWTAAATTSPAPASGPLRPGPDSLIRRAARHIGHQAHSGESIEASGGGSVVATPHTSPGSARFGPNVLRNCPVSSLRMLRALDRTSHRWNSAARSLPGVR